MFTDDPPIRVGAGQMQYFTGSFRAWERTLTVAGDKQYRVALKLEAPPRQGGKQTKNSEAVWRLKYLLQARDDASLLVPAAEAWKTKGSVLQSLDRHIEQPQERLLTGLGYAARFFQPIQRSLKQRAPTDARRTTDEVYALLRQCAPHLQRVDFGLLVPPWWNRPGKHLGLRLKLSSTSKLTGQPQFSHGHMNQENLINYRWQLSLGNTELSRKEFDALGALKSPLVQIRGQWVQLDAKQIEAAIQFWRRQDFEGNLSLHEASQLGLGGETQMSSDQCLKGKPVLVSVSASSNQGFVQPLRRK